MDHNSDLRLGRTCPPLEDDIFSERRTQEDNCFSGRTLLKTTQNCLKTSYLSYVNTVTNSTRHSGAFKTSIITGSLLSLVAGCEGPTTVKSKSSSHQVCDSCRGTGAN